MQRRSFLQLILATPLIPALAKLERIAPPPALPVIGLARDLRAMRYALFIGSASLVHRGRVERYVCKPPHTFRPDRLLVGPLSQDFELLHVAANGEAQMDTAVPREHVLAACVRQAHSVWQHQRERGDCFRCAKHGSGFLTLHGIVHRQLFV